MGGKSSKQTIGHKYSLGIHAIFCLSAIDYLLELTLDKRPFWRGRSTGGQIFWNKPDLLGGKKREGGTSGYADVEMGASDQVQNDYLVSQLGPLVPGHRGVFGIVFRRPYLGNNPYLKPFAAKVQRVHLTPAGNAQWYPEKAAIPGQASVGGASIYIAMDASASMSGARMAAQKQAVVDLLASVRDNSDARNDFRIVTWSTSALSAIQRRKCDGDDDYQVLIDWVEALSNSATGATNFEAAVDSARQFFNGTDSNDYWEKIGFPSFPAFGEFFGQFSADGSKDNRRIVVFLTDGIPTDPASATAAAELLQEIAALEVYCFNIDEEDTTYTELLDNTPTDGVPVIEGGDSTALLEAISVAFSDGDDLNGIHFGRDILLYPEDASSAIAALIGDSFEPAADKLFDERFGLSLEFKNPRAKRENLVEIERHIDGRFYRDRLTGKWEVKLVRDDYEISELPVFDRSNVISWGDFSRKDPRYQPNQVTVVYTHPKRNEPASVTVTDTARVQLAGRIINEKVEYRGIRNDRLARQVAYRDLRALGNALLTGHLTAFPPTANVNRGYPVLLNNEKLGIDNVVCRIADLTEGDGRTNEVEIEVIEDAFAQPSGVLVADPPDPPEPDLNYPEPSDYRLVEEAPYYQLAQILGDRELENLLTEDNTVGYLNLAAESPTGDAIDATVFVDAGAGFDEIATMDFVPVVVLLNSLSREADDTVVITSLDPVLQEIPVGSLGAIGTEYVRFDGAAPGMDVFAVDDMFALEDVFGDFATMVLARGCLDTVPQAHTSGSAVIFWGAYTNNPQNEYYDAQSIDVKLLTQSGRGTLDPDDAPTDNVIFDLRAWRPYAPGKFQCDGSYADQIVVDTLTLTWAHRDRTLQTSATVVDDHTEDDIGPEDGVTYRLTGFAVDKDLVEVSQIIDQNLGTNTSWEFSYTALEGDVFTQIDMFAVEDVFNLGLPEAASAIRFDITSWRDGVRSWQSPSIYAYPLLAPGNLTAEEI